MRLEALIGQAEERRRAGRLGEAREQFLAAAATAERVGDGKALVRAAIGAGGIWLQEERDVVARAAVRAVWERASDVVAPGSLEQARLTVRVLAEAVYEGGSPDPVAGAVERVRAFGDDAALAEALSLQHHLMLGPGHTERRLAVAEEIVRLGARARDPLLAVIGLCWRTIDLFLLGAPRASQSHAELRERSAALGCEALSFVADLLDAMLLARAGRLAEAEAASVAAHERGRAAGDPDAPAYHGAMLAALRWWQGRAAEIVDAVWGTSTSPRLGSNDHGYVAAGALLSATLGDRDSAEEALARLTGAGLDRVPDSSSWLATVFLAVEAAYLLGDAEMATVASELLAPYAHLPVMPSLAVVCLGSAERALGLAAATAGRLDAAAGHLEAALRADRVLGNRPMSVLTEHTLSAVLARGGRPGDEARAGGLARQAEERARRMGVVLPNHPAWLGRRRGVTAPTAPSREAWLQRASGSWRLGLAGRVTVLADRVGFRYLADLVGRPGEDVDVLGLAAGAFLGAGSAPDAVLDEEALRSYRRRARELDAVLARPDLGRADAERARAELSALTEELRATTALAGRRRAFPHDHERARTAVRKALVRAVAAIRDVEPDLGRHLETSLVTGARCRYDPASGWAVSVRAPARRPKD